ncbi:mevalonate kinase [Carnobacterium gallinarum]|uniref:mevalonate kinase n=1 Tax=Carnobacterium gallinarum TaxID=2749 RepID=UPI00054F2D59|nr:mevalonate kinase [Carnobacterium gallinarum]
MIEPISVGRGQATGKIILMGEHAVVYGEPAIAIPFPAVTIDALIESTTQPEIELNCYFYQGLLSEAPSSLGNLKVAIEKTLVTLKQPMSHLKLTIHSTVPAERGMGSSAAVAVSTIRGLYDYFKVPLSTEKLLNLTNLAESVAHGNPSGLDAAMTSGTVPLYYVKNQPFQPFDLQLKAYLIVADTGITGQTRAAVADVAALYQANPLAVQPKITALGDLVKKSKEAIERNLPVELGAYMNQAQQLLSELTVSSPELDRLIAAANTAGALGAKLTGGGRGGCLLALTTDIEMAKSIESALKNNGATMTWIYQMGGN